MPTGIITVAEARAKGLPFYWTGLPCKHGHIALRRTSGRSCTACRRAIDKRSYDKHREKRIDKSKRWNAKHPERRREIMLANAEACREADRRWKNNHPEEVKAYRRKKTAEDPGFKLRINLSNRICQAVRYVWGHKSAKTLELLGCTIAELRVHLERQFLPGMTWANYGYGKKKWHIDHIRACAMFDLADAEEQKRCFHFTNLRPLWQQDNLSKNKRLTCLL